MSVQVSYKKQITLAKGQTEHVTLEVSKTTFSGSLDVNVNSSSTSTFSDIVITHENSFSLSDKTTITVEIMASEHALSGTHKVLLGAYTDDIAVSKFITVTIV